MSLVYQAKYCIFGRNGSEHLPVYKMNDCYQHIWHNPFSADVIREVYRRESFLQRPVIISETLKHLCYPLHKGFPKTVLTMQPFLSHVPSNYTQGMDSFALLETSQLPLINSMRCKVQSGCRGNYVSVHSLKAEVSCIDIFISEICVNLLLFVYNVQQTCMCLHETLVYGVVYVFQMPLLSFGLSGCIGGELLVCSCSEQTYSSNFRQADSKSPADIQTHSVDASLIQEIQSVNNQVCVISSIMLF